MASSINASTTAGVVTTADTSGVLNIQTAGATAISIDASQAVSFTNSPTVTGGTANGVAYLNGSKVLTTGSALVFDGTNLGVGNAPNAGWSGAKVLQMGLRTNLWNLSDNSYLSTNAYFDGTNSRYIGTQLATMYSQQNDGAHKFYVAPSGTAGNAITFTQAMTLNASGQLILGDTTADGRLKVVETAAGAGVTFYNSANNSAGQIGTTNEAGAANSLEINAYRGSGRIVFKTNNTYAASIDSSGNLLVGTTSATGKTTVVQTAAASYGSDIRCSSATYTSVVLNIGADRNTTDGTYAMIQATRYGAATCFKVLDSGNVQNTNNSYGALSDIKLKENIVDATPKLADLMQVKVRSYNLKSDPLHKQLGVIAQELETVFPGLVDESPDYEQQIKTREVEVPAVAEVRDNEGNVTTQAVEATTKTEEYTEQVALGTTTKSVKYSVFVPMLIKAIQEQQALITQLQADVALLKGATP